MNGRSARTTRRLLARLSLAAGFICLSASAARAQFTTVINVPPNIGNNQSIGSNTQLNLFDGGSISLNFDAGATNGSSMNVEVNIFGGYLGVFFEAFGGSTINISGGFVDSGFDAESGSLVNISGGSIRSEFDAISGSAINISGGAFGDDFDASNDSAVRITGNDFRLNGGPIEGLGTIGDTVAVELPTAAVLSGVTADGRTFAFLRHDSDSFAAGTLTLEAAELPVAMPGVFMASTNPLPLGVRASQTLVVDAGAVVGNNYNAAPGSTLEVQDGGTVGTNLEAVGAVVSITGGNVGGDFDAASGAIVHISGGVVGNFFDALGGSIVNISGGSVGSDFDAVTGSLVNISGGSVGSGFRAFGGTVNISGGSVGVALETFGGTLNISGGSIGGAIDVNSGSVVNISGGEFTDDFRAFGGSMVRITGNDFHLNGVPIEGLGSNGSTVAVDIPAGGILNGVTADGRPFAFFALDSDIFSVGTLILEAAELPVAAPGVFMASTNPLPLGVRAGQTLIVDSAAVVGNNYNAAPGSTLEVHSGGAVGVNFEAVGVVVNVTGGSVGENFDAGPGTIVHISGGTVGGGFDAFAGSTVHISGGSVGGVHAESGSLVNISGGSVGGIQAFGDSTVNISGGSLNGSFDAFADSTINISAGLVGGGAGARNGSAVNIAGGSIGVGFDAFGGSTTNISGGVIDNDFDADNGSVVNIYGTQFILAGVDISATLTEDVLFTLTNRNVTLAGELADGSPFDFMLNSANLQNADYFHTGAILTITLVQGIPGDFNDDGIVDAADFTVWRDALGSTVTTRGSGGDGNFDGLVTEADYYVWKTHFGEPGGGGGASGLRENVPEPSAIALSLTICAGCILSIRARHSRGES